MVEYIKDSVNDSTSAKLDASFSAMADPTRRAILARLALGEARVTEIASAFPMSLNAVSKHIKILERSQLVTRSVQGRDHVLSLNAGAMLDAAAWIEHYRQFWEGQLASLETFITQQRIRAKQGDSQ